MTLLPGARLGPYEVIGRAGSGGMGEVWRARDTRLDRSVAIKVLPAELAHNAQFKVRFEREARVISQLSHPHICTLYDVGEHEGRDYLVMEFLEGETLADRLARGPLPVDQVVRYGIQIAEGLEKAHKAGVTHRDLKPGNVMITRAGAKLLDFGLAKPSAAVDAVGELTSLRTEAKNPLTEEGTIVGTFQYMAPEQIEAGAVDQRTDLFAFGAVLYEMATGRRAFSGKSKASLIASILTTEPQPISALAPATPAMLDRIIRTCLAKEPDERFQNAHDVAEALRWVTDVPEGAPAKAARRGRLAWIVAGVLALATLAAGTLLWRERAATRNAPPVRTMIVPPGGTDLDVVGTAAPPAISHDGRKIVFGAARPAKSRTLWVRSLDDVVARELPGTEGASYPAWAPDDRTIAFFAGTELKKIDVSGGAPVVICPVVDGRGASWSRDGRTIVFAGRYTPIHRVSSAGGSPVVVTKFEPGIGSHRWPQFLPDGRHFLFLSSPTGSEDPRNTIGVGSVDGSVQKTLFAGGNDPHYFDGTVLFVRNGLLTAQPIDLERLTAVGEPVAVGEEKVEGAFILARTVVSVSPAGTLVYRPGSAERIAQMAWVDRAGKKVAAIGEPGPFTAVALDPDGQRVVASQLTTSQSNLWLFDARGVKSRLTFRSGFDVSPAWSPDGKKLAYATRSAATKTKIVVRDVETGAEEEVFEETMPGNPGPTSWSPDGTRLLVTLSGATTRGDVWWISLAGRSRQPYLKTEFVEAGGRVSPDGRWIAYVSNETGTAEVYLAPYPPTGAKWQVSTGGGIAPRWRSDGRELYYGVTGSTSLMVGSGGTMQVVGVPVVLGHAPQIGQPQALFSFNAAASNHSVFDVAPDGNRFVILELAGAQEPPQPMVVVQHFDNVLRAAIEASRR